MEKKIKETTRAAYDKVGADYDSWYYAKAAKKLRAELTGLVLSKLKKGLKSKRNPNVLDLCCGTGQLTEGLSQIGEYLGADFSKSMVESCKKRFPKESFVLADAEDLSFEDESFDAVVCFWSFHHIIHPKRAVEEMSRVLKPDGVLVIATFKDMKLNFAAKLADFVSDHYWKFKTNRYSEKEMRNLLSERFNSVSIEIYPKGFSILNTMGIRFLVCDARK